MISFVKKIVWASCLIVFSICSANSSEAKPQSITERSTVSSKQKSSDFFKASNKRKLSDLVFGVVKRQKTESGSKIRRNADSGRVVVDINEGVMKPVNVALHIYDNSQSLEEEFLSVIKDDLQSTGLFKAIPNTAFMQKLQGVDQTPDFDSWRIIKTEYLMNAEVKQVEDNISIGFALYDVSSCSKIHIFSLSGRREEWRKMAHKVANAIYQRVVGEEGYFDTKVLYVATEKDKRGLKKYRLALMDQDGYNNQFLTSGNTVVLTPRFSPNGREFSFFSYREKIVNGRRVPLDAQIYRYDLRKRKMTRMLNMKGITYAPRYSPDGRYLIFSRSEKNSKGRSVSSIYRYDIVKGKVKRLNDDAHKYICIDTSPCYSPDGKYIVFNSDRGGNQQLYIMDADGFNVRRLSFGNGRYATPVWSPRGDWIAFTKFGKDGFYIGIIRPNDVSGSTERMIAAGYLVEGPTWAPNGRVIMYTQQDYSRREQVYSVDITGHNKQLVKTPGNAIDPEWSANTNLK